LITLKNLSTASKLARVHHIGENIRPWPSDPPVNEGLVFSTAYPH
jgi:hypothetical protein